MKKQTILFEISDGKWKLHEPPPPPNNTRICKAKWAEPFNPPPLSLSLSLSPPPPLSLSLCLHKFEILNWLGLDLVQSAVRFAEKV